MEKSSFLFDEQQGYSVLKVKLWSSTTGGKMLEELVSLSSTTVNEWRYFTLKDLKSIMAEQIEQKVMKDGVEDVEYPKGCFIAYIFNSLKKFADKVQTVSLPRILSGEEIELMKDLGDWSKSELQASVKTYEENPQVAKSIIAERKNGRIVIKIFERTAVLKFVLLEIQDHLAQHKKPLGKQDIFFSTYLKSLYQPITQQVIQTEEEKQTQLLQSLVISQKPQRGRGRANAPRGSGPTRGGGRGRGRAGRGRGRGQTGMI